MGAYAPWWDHTDCYVHIGSRRSDLRTTTLYFGTASPAPLYFRATTTAYSRSDTAADLSAAHRAATDTNTGYTDATAAPCAVMTVMKPIRLALFATLSCLLLLALVRVQSAVSTVAAQVQTITLNPTCGPPGATVTVLGLGWLLLPPNQDLNIYWDSTSGPLLGTIENLNALIWSTEVTIPDDATPGVHAIIAVRHNQSASATFTVPCAGATVTPTPPPTNTPLPTPTNTPIVTPSPTAEPPIHALHLPANFNNYTSGEPNDSCPQALPLMPNRSYHFLPEDRDDWYYFDLSQPGHLVVELMNFVPIAGQITLWGGGPCHDLVLLDHNGDFATTKIVDVGMQPTGRYYIWLITDGPYSHTDPYQLTIHFN